MIKQRTFYTLLVPETRFPWPNFYDRRDRSSEKNLSDQLLAELEARLRERVHHVEDSG